VLPATSRASRRPDERSRRKEGSSAPTFGRQDIGAVLSGDGTTVAHDLPLVIDRRGILEMDLGAAGDQRVEIPPTSSGVPDCSERDSPTAAHQTNYLGAIVDSFRHSVTPHACWALDCSKILYPLLLRVKKWMAQGREWAVSDGRRADTLARVIDTGGVSPECPQRAQIADLALLIPQDRVIVERPRSDAASLPR